MAAACRSVKVTGSSSLLLAPLHLLARRGRRTRGERSVLAERVTLIEACYCGGWPREVKVNSLGHVHAGCLDGLLGDETPRGPIVKVRRHIWVKPQG